MKKVLITIIIFLSPMFALAEDRMARALVSATEKVFLNILNFLYTKIIVTMVIIEILINKIEDPDGKGLEFIKRIRAKIPTIL